MFSRLSKIKNELQQQNFDAVLVSSIPNITYLTGYSGFSKEEREALILVTKDKQYILTDKRYKDEIKNILYSSSEEQSDESRSSRQDGYQTVTRQARTINFFELEEVSSSIPYLLALEKLIAKHKIKKLGIEEDDLTASEYKSLKRCSIDLNHWSITDFRTVKENNEIKTIKKACELTDKTFKYILTKIRPGVTEKELAFEIEFFIKKHGGDLAFPSIVAFGKNSAVPHHKPVNNVLGPSTRSARSGQEGQIVLLDFGAKVPASPSQGGDNYCSDMTRVVFLGKASDEQKKVYETVLEAQKKAMEYINNVIFSSLSDGLRAEGLNKVKDLGIPRDSSASPQNDILTKNVDKAAHDYIRKQGFRENIFHSLGHGVGLEIHESPHLSAKSKETLKPGMVFTIEPGIYIPEQFGVRIEDLAVLEDNGLKILTKSKKQLIEL